MDLPELFEEIFNYLNIKDKKSLLLTCKKYYKPNLLNIKCAVFICSYDDHGYENFELIAICDTINKSKQLIQKNLLKQTINSTIYSTMTKENNYTLICSRSNLNWKHRTYNYLGIGYIIEEILLNQLI